VAHFAKLDDNNIVLEVNVLNNNVIDNLPFPESELLGVSFLTEWSKGYIKWKQTSYNNSFRVRYAGVGYNYDAVLDAFIAPQPYPSWTLDTETTEWLPPIPMPTDGKRYTWNEDTQTWVEINV